MSASAKLRQFDSATPLEKYGIDLFRYLPEIIDLVNAAESLYAEAATSAPLWDKLDAALIALNTRLEEN